MEIPVHAEERVLTQIPRVVGVTDHTVDDVPTEPLVRADQRLESARRPCKHGRDQQPVGVDAGGDGTLLAEAAPRVGASDALARAYTSAASSISSDFDHREALTALADRAELTPAGWRLLLESAGGISADFDCATLLEGVAPQLTARRRRRSRPTARR